MKNFANVAKIIAAILLIIAGLIALVNCLISVSYTSYVPKQSYGGDAYTGIQNAGATTANNVASLISLMQKIGSALMLALGFAFIGLGFYILSGIKKSEEPTVEAAPAAAPATVMPTVSVPKAEVAAPNEAEYVAAPIENASAERVCPSCNHIAKTGTSFCQNCGTKLI